MAPDVPIEADAAAEGPKPPKSSFGRDAATIAKEHGLPPTKSSADAIDQRELAGLQALFDRTLQEMAQSMWLKKKGGEPEAKIEEDPVEADDDGGVTTYDLAERMVKSVLLAQGGQMLGKPSGDMRDNERMMGVIDQMVQDQLSQGGDGGLRPEDSVSANVEDVTTDLPLDTLNFPEHISVQIVYFDGEYVIPPSCVYDEREGVVKVDARIFSGGLQYHIPLGHLLASMVMQVLRYHLHQMEVGGFDEEETSPPEMAKVNAFLSWIGRRVLSDIVNSEEDADVRRGTQALLFPPSHCTGDISKDCRSMSAHLLESTAQYRRERQLESVDPQALSRKQLLNRPDALVPSRMEGYRAASEVDVTQGIHWERLLSHSNAELLRRMRWNTYESWFFEEWEEHPSSGLPIGTRLVDDMGSIWEKRSGISTKGDCWEVVSGPSRDMIISDEEMDACRRMRMFPVPFTHPYMQGRLSKDLPEDTVLMDSEGRVWRHTEQGDWKVEHSTTRSLDPRFPQSHKEMDSYREQTIGALPIHDPRVAVCLSEELPVGTCLIGPEDGCIWKKTKRGWERLVHDVNRMRLYKPLADEEMTDDRLELLFTGAGPFDPLVDTAMDGNRFTQLFASTHLSEALPVGTYLQNPAGQRFRKIPNQHTAGACWQIQNDEYMGLVLTNERMDHHRGVSVASSSEDTIPPLTHDAMQAYREQTLGAIPIYDSEIAIHLSGELPVGTRLIDPRDGFVWKKTEKGWGRLVHNVSRTKPFELLDDAQMDDVRFELLCTSEDISEALPIGTYLQNQAGQRFRKIHHDARGQLWQIQNGEYEGRVLTNERMDHHRRVPAASFPNKTCVLDSLGRSWQKNGERWVLNVESTDASLTDEQMDDLRFAFLFAEVPGEASSSLPIGIVLMDPQGRFWRKESSEGVCWRMIYGGNGAYTDALMDQYRIESIDPLPQLSSLFPKEGDADLVAQKSDWVLQTLGATATNPPGSIPDHHVAEPVRVSHPSEQCKVGTSVTDVRGRWWTKEAPNHWVMLGGEGALTDAMMDEQRGLGTTGEETAADEE